MLGEGALTTVPPRRLRFSLARRRHCQDAVEIPPASRHRLTTSLQLYVSPGVTRYCFPPFSITAYITNSLLLRIGSSPGPHTLYSGRAGSQTFSVLQKANRFYHLPPDLRMAGLLQENSSGRCNVEFPSGLVTLKSHGAYRLYGPLRRSCKSSRVQFLLAIVTR